MKSLRRLATASALAVAVVAAFATPAFAHSTTSARPEPIRPSRHDHDTVARGADHVVFVQTDNPPATRSSRMTEPTTAR